MKSTLTRVITIVFPGFTVDGVAIFLHQLIFNSWSALGNVATNITLQYLAGATLSRGETLRSVISQLLPVIFALLWPSPMQRFQRSTTVTESTTITNEPARYIAPRDISDKDK